MSTGRILVVEDEERLAAVLVDYLKLSGFEAHVIANGNDVVPWVRVHAPELILLDVMLPGRDGLELLRELRGFTSVPVILVTARVEELDRLLGLELGADDYICKPFSPREVVARVRAVLRRFAPAASGGPGTATQHLVLDADAFRVRMAERQVQLTAVEFRLLEALCRQPGRIFSRDALMDRIYPDGRVVSDRTIDSHVKKLRRKLAAVAPGQELVRSVYGAGYRYELEVGGTDAASG